MKLKKYSIYYFNNNDEILNFCKHLNIKLTKFDKRMLEDDNVTDKIKCLIYPCWVTGYENEIDFISYSKEGMPDTITYDYPKKITYTFIDGIKELRKIKLEKLK